MKSLYKFLAIAAIAGLAAVSNAYADDDWDDDGRREYVHGRGHGHGHGHGWGHDWGHHHHHHRHWGPRPYYYGRPYGPRHYAPQPQYYPVPVLPLPPLPPLPLPFPRHHGGLQGEVPTLGDQGQPGTMAVAGQGPEAA